MRVFAAVTVAVLAFAPAASAQQKFTVLGPNECLNCHDHDDQRAWYEKKEIPEDRMADSRQLLGGSESGWS